MAAGYENSAALRSDLDALREGSNALLHLWPEVPDKTLKTELHTIISTALQEKMSYSVVRHRVNQHRVHQLTLHVRLHGQMDYRPATTATRGQTRQWYFDTCNAADTASA